MKLLHILFLVLPVSCASNSYIEPSRDMPHATLKCETTGKLGSLARMLAVGGSNVAPIQINGRDVSNTWKSGVSDRRIPAGKTNIMAKAIPSSKVTATTNLQFLAKPNKIYVLSQNNEMNSFLFRIKEESSGSVVVQKRASKEAAPVSVPAYIPIFLPVR